MFSRAYKRYALTILTLVYMMSVLDQGLITLLLEPIKQDLKLTDTQLGLLTGLAFGLFYATLGLPIGRWADRGNRSTIASAAIGVWGGAVMLCLAVTNFGQLALARMAAAVGGAGAMPPTYALVGDYFPSLAERTRAMAIYMSANPLSLMVSFALGGWLNEHYGWRITFFVMGIPALLLAALVKISIREPRTHSSRARSSPLPRMTDVLSSLWRQRSMRHLFLGLITFYTMGFGLAPWYAAFMMRSHGMSTAEVGVWFALIFGVGGIAGVLLGGYVTARWFAANERGQMRLIALTIGSLVPCLVAFLMLSERIHALIALVPLMVLFNFYYGPTFAMMQRLVADETRATTVAVAMLLYNLVGMGIGPWLVGLLSDSLSPVIGSDSLRFGMLIMSLVAFWAAYHFWEVGRTVTEDLCAVAECIRSDAGQVAASQ